MTLTSSMCHTYSLLPRPPVLTTVPTATMRTCTPATSSLSWLGFPASAMFNFGRMHFPFDPLPVPEFFHKIWRSEPEVHEVAETATIALSIFILPATSFPEVRDGGQLGIKRPSCIPSLIAVVYSSLRFRLPLIARVHVAN